MSVSTSVCSLSLQTISVVQIQLQPFGIYSTRIFDILDLLSNWNNGIRALLCSQTEKNPLFMTEKSLQFSGKLLPVIDRLDVY